MRLFEWFKHLVRTLNSRAEPTDAAVGGQSAPTSVVAEASSQIGREVDAEQELEEGR